MSHLANAALFVKLPESRTDKLAPALIADFGSSYAHQIDTTYHLINSHELSPAQVLQVWETRLLLHLFNNQLGFAKKEALNLNNALYLHENANTLNPNIPVAQRSRSNSSLSSPPQPIYPLPKNNDSAISYSLLVLLLRLKSVPNMNLVNELYKLDYQLRLRYSANKSSKSKLMNLSYDVVVILVVTKNHLTLLSYLKGLKHELDHLDDADYAQYLSNMTLILIIIESSLFIAKGRDTAALEAEFQTSFDTITPETRDSLTFVLRTVLTSVASKETVDITGISLAELLQLVKDEKVTSRIICSTLGLWDLLNRFPQLKFDGIQLLNDEDVPQTEDSVDAIHNKVVNTCYKYIYKVYGLE